MYLKKFRPKRKYIEVMKTLLQKAESNLPEYISTEQNNSFQQWFLKQTNYSDEALHNCFPVFIKSNKCTKKALCNRIALANDVLQQSTFNSIKGYINLYNYCILKNIY